MAGKVLVYGASGGIGSATARRLHERGYALHLAGRSEERLAALAEELDADFTAGDVLDPEYFDRVTGEVGDSLAGLVYAVGTINLKAFARLTDDDYTRDFRVNSLGAAAAIRAALPALKKAPDTASVVLFSTVAVSQGFPSHASVAMAKGAVAGLTVSLAAELAPRIRVNAVAPSLTDTPLAKGLLSNEQMAQAIAAMHPLPRLGRADDIASLAAFLVSEESTWITGQVFGVDGGRSTLRIKA